MEVDPLKTIAFKELNFRDKIFMIIMVVLVIITMLPWGDADDSYYYDDESYSKNYSSSLSREEYEEAFREADRAQRYLEEYNMKKNF